MGSQNIIGLIISLGADTSDANAAMQQYAQQTGQSLGAVQAQVNDYQRAESSAYAESVQGSRGASQEMNKNLLSNRESVRLLSEEMGVHLPRAVSGAVAEMLPQIANLGTMMLGAFAIEAIVKFGGELKKAAAEWGGYTKEVQAAEQADIKANEALLTHFQTTAKGLEYIAESNRELARIARDNANYIPALNAAAQSAKLSWLDLLGPVGIAIKDYGTFGKAQKAVVDSDKEEVKVRERLIEQLNGLKELEIAEHKAKAGLATGSAAVAVTAIQEAAAFSNFNVVLPASVQAMKEMAEAERQMMLVGRDYQFTTLRPTIAELPIMKTNLDTVTASIQVQITMAQRLSNAWHGAVTAMGSQTATQIEGAVEGVAQLIGGQRAFAGVKAATETAAGIEALAEGTWPPNPAAIAAAAMHFESAVEWGKIAGTSSQRGGGGGSVGSGSGSGGSGGSQAVDRGSGAGVSGSGGGRNSQYSQTVLQISGGALNSNGQQQLAAWIGMGSAIGLYKFNASGSSGIAAPRY